MRAVHARQELPWQAAVVALVDSCLSRECHLSCPGIHTNCSQERAVGKASSAFVGCAGKLGGT